MFGFPYGATLPTTYTDVYYVVTMEIGGKTRWLVSIEADPIDTFTWASTIEQGHHFDALADAELACDHVRQYHNKCTATVDHFMTELSFFGIPV